MTIEKNKQRIKNGLLFTSFILLMGCFETKKDPVSTQTQESNIPLNNTSIPENTTHIRAMFRRGASQNWMDAQNWGVDLCGGSKDDSKYTTFFDKKTYNFIPGKGTVKDIPANVRLYKNCYVNESVDVYQLDLGYDRHLTIPEGVTLRSTGGFWGKRTTILGQGALELLGKLGYNGEQWDHGTGNVTLDIFIAPYMQWVGDVKVRIARLPILHVNQTLTVKERLDVSKLMIKDDMDINVAHMNIYHVEDPYHYLIISERTQPLHVQHLSFEPGTELEVILPQGDKQGPVQLKGYIDVTHMNLVVRFSNGGWGTNAGKDFSEVGPIGEKVPVLIAEQGIIGDPKVLREHRRVLVSGYCPGSFPGQEEDYLKRQLMRYIWTEGDGVYIQRMVLPYNEQFLVDKDEPYQKTAKDTFEESRQDFSAHPKKNYLPEIILNLTKAQWDLALKLSRAMLAQRKAIYEKATEDGIDRYMDVLVTPDARERVLKFLKLFDIGEYDTQVTEVSERGRQALVDILSQGRMMKGEGMYRLSPVSQGLQGIQGMGFGYQTSAFQSVGALVMPSRNFGNFWNLGLDHTFKMGSFLGWTCHMQGMFRQEKSNQWIFKTGVTMKLAEGIYIGGTMGHVQHTATTGEESYTFKAVPVSSRYGYQGDVYVEAGFEHHGVNMCGTLTYQPEQSVDIHVSDLGVTVSQLPLQASWQPKISLGYVYMGNEGIRMSTQLVLHRGTSFNIYWNAAMSMEW